MGFPHLLTRFALALLSLGVGSCQRVDIDVEPGVSRQLAEYRAAAIDSLNYRLHLDIPREQDQDISGRMLLDFDLSDVSQALQLDFRSTVGRVRRVVVNARDSDFEFRGDHLIIPRQGLVAGKNRIEVEFIAGSDSLNRNPDYLYTLFVPDRARTAFPVFDQPDLKATWELSLRIPADWSAVSAAAVERVEPDGEYRTVYFQRSDLISSYLFSFAAGAFETISRDVGGRPMNLLHRETDPARVARNVDEIFRLHAAALDWLEKYTGIDYPFRKFDFVLLPAHPYGGMEHVGAIQYRAESLWLEEAPSDTELLNRASLIAHETAHMWFGNLVTMRWFDDVWTKEVFANFMAAKIVNPSFPAIDHDLNFLVSHHPSAYSVDRTAGANPIRQPLRNLDQAGQLYGAIIYHKAPIMMRQLEAILGEDAFRLGMREYLGKFAHANASWPELIEILDRGSTADLAAWSDVWVNSAGRPRFTLERGQVSTVLQQEDPAGRGRLWPQALGVQGLPPADMPPLELVFQSHSRMLPDSISGSAAGLVLNADGRGYGLFPADPGAMEYWAQLGDLARASLLINLQEQMLETGQPAPAYYLDLLVPIIEEAENQLVLNLALAQLRRIYWTLLPDSTRIEIAPRLEAMLWQAMLTSEQDALRKIYFDSFANVALTPDGLQAVSDLWSGDLEVENLPLSERDMIGLTRLLAIKLPERASAYVAGQLARTRNPDEQRRLAFMAPSLSASQEQRDRFFTSLAEEKNRQTESWVLDALENLHHPLRVKHSRRYVPASLELLEAVQTTGDIFFPAGWLDRTLGNHHSDSVLLEVESFLAQRPDYNPQLRLKILQAVDAPLRANRLRKQHD